jgi:hypothetical protein
MKNYIMPDNVRQTFNDALRTQAGYEAIADAVGMKSADGQSAAASQSAGTAEGGSGFWLVALIVLILSAIFSLFGGNSSQAESPAEAPIPGGGSEGR